MAFKSEFEQNGFALVENVFSEEEVGMHKREM